MKNLGAKIRRMRLETRMSQVDFAKKMGFSDHTPISKIESGKRALSAEQLMRVAAIFGKSISEFAEPITRTGGGGETEGEQDMTPEELGILRMFRELSPEQQALMRRLLIPMDESEMKKITASKK